MTFFATLVLALAQSGGPALPALQPPRPFTGETITYSFNVPSPCYGVAAGTLIEGNHITIFVSQGPLVVGCPQIIVRREVLFESLPAGRYMVTVDYGDTAPAWSFIDAFDVLPVPIPIAPRGAMVALAVALGLIACRTMSNSCRF